MSQIADTPGERRLGYPTKLVSTVSLLLRLALTLGVFRLLGLPIARYALPGLPAASYALATGVGLVAATHLTWILAQLGLPLAFPAIAAGIAAVAAVSILCAVRLRRAGRPLRPRLIDAVTHHLAFAAALGFALLVTARNPGVDPDSERFMDFAMVKAVLSSRTLPLEDPWLGGERVAYYDYGYYASAYLSLLVGPAEKFFPVAVALLYASLFAGVLALGRDLAGEIGGLLAGYLVGVAGNLDGLLQTIRRGLWAGYDWFHGARVIDGGITEFPLFTLLWGDLHPYALALPLWPLLIAIGVLIARGEANPLSLALGAVGYAALTATHTWDSVPIAALLCLAALVVGRRPRALLGPLVVVLGGALLAAPYLRHMPLGGRGFGIVQRPSSLAELFAAWGATLLILLVAALVDVSGDEGLRERHLAGVGLLATLAVVSFKTPGTGIALAASLLFLLLAWRRSSFPWAVAAIGAGLVFGVEVFYLDDFYSGDLERMNTVFKAYVQAWVLLQFAAAVLLAGLLARAAASGSTRRSLVLSLAVTVCFGTAIYPLRAVPARAGDLLAPRPLDATREIVARYPDDARAIARLAELPRGLILETTGEPYSWNSRFATFTGFPCLVGWGHHETGWRNTSEPMLTRGRQIKDVYTAKTLEPLERLTRQHPIAYVVVGALEREQYPIEALEKFETLKPLIREGETVVYEAPRR